MDLAEKKWEEERRILAEALASKGMVAMPGALVSGGRRGNDIRGNGRK